MPPPSDDEDYYKRASGGSRRDERPRSIRSRHRYSPRFSPRRRHRDRSRSYSPERRHRDRGRRSHSPPRRSHSRDRCKTSHHPNESKYKSESFPKLKVESKLFECSQPVDTKVSHNSKAQERMELKAKAKLTVLSKLGIELKLPEEKKPKLWRGKTETKNSGTVWNGASFGDSKATAKFKRLMGIRDGEPEKSASTSGVNITQQQVNLFKKMEEEYEVARQTTHTMRGVGLGFPK